MCPEISDTGVMDPRRKGRALEEEEEEEVVVVVVVVRREGMGMERGRGRLVVMGMGCGMVGLGTQDGMVLEMDGREVEPGVGIAGGVGVLGEDEGRQWCGGSSVCLCLNIGFTP